MSDKLLMLEIEVNVMFYNFSYSYYDLKNKAI